MLGAGSLATIKRDSYPNVEFGELLITTAYPGASPEDVELNVTNKIEKELKEVTGIKRYQSWSQENVSTVHVVIDPDEDEDDVEREVREAVARVTDLPREVKESPLVTELGTKVIPMIEVGLAGDIVQVRVVDVDVKRQRIGLSMRSHNKAPATSKPSDTKARNKPTAKGKSRQSKPDTAMANAFSKLQELKIK